LFICHFSFKDVGKLGIKMKQLALNPAGQEHISLFNHFQSLHFCRQRLELRLIR